MGSDNKEGKMASNLPCCNCIRDTAMYNVVVHGIVFMILFAAFQTAAEYAEPVLADLHQPNLGFESAAVVYSTLAIGRYFTYFVFHLILNI